MSYFSDVAKSSIKHQGAPDRGEMERKLNRFLLKYAQEVSSESPEKAYRVRCLTIPRWPLQET